MRRGVGLSKERAELFPEGVCDAFGRPVPYDRSRALVVERGRADAIDLPGIRLDPETPVLMGINALLPERASGTLRFDLMRVARDRIVGGIGYELRVVGDPR